MVRILFVYKQFPAPSVGHAGGESLFRLMEALHQKGHNLILVARIADEERKLLPMVEEICEHVYTVPHHRSMPGAKPVALLRSYGAFRRMTKRVLRDHRPDLIHVETTQTAMALVGLSLPPSSFRTQDVNWFLQRQKAAHARGIKRLIAQLLGAFFRWSEPLLCRHHDLILAISEGDKALLSSMCPDSSPLLLPLAPAVSPAMDVVPAVPAAPNLLFVGAMSRNHNIDGVGWFLDCVWPRIRAVVPEAHFYIVGGAPSAELRRRGDEHCTVTGFVDDLAPWYRAATVFVSPLLVAGGLLQKVVDAMALSVPVVATSVCNHGLGATPGEHLVTADTPEAFAAAVVDLLGDSVTRARIGVAGQQFIQAHYDAAASVKRWEAALLAMLAS